jgi:Glycoside hydrolase family 44/Secretion system C-terminal sorting domain
MRHLLTLCLLLHLNAAFSQAVTVSIDPTKDVKTISPNLYGRNNSLPKESYAAPLSPADYVRLRESGVRFLREGGGNNSTKYNWRKRLSSHPDWYNNVYENNWDIAVKTMRDSLPTNVNGMWSFQLIGKAAANVGQNFNDWGYNRSQWWTGTAQNLAGGGQPNTTGGSVALTAGNPNLYLENWPADSTTGILDYWINTLNVQKQRITYWNMDNEPEIWNGTHDDVISATYQAEAFMQSYFAVAKKARAKFPNIKLVGPTTANEWQWFNWMNRITGADGKYYCWLEYFIKRCAEEERATGVRVLDVVDIHFYPSENTAEQVVQLHHVFFDRDYAFSGANGVKNLTGSWNASQNKEYIFGRINDWLNVYFSQNHGIKLGITEMDVENTTPSVIAVWYASMMGEFMKNDVDIFTPWSWRVGMWETLHLFARYNQTSAVQGTSSDETFVSSYPSVNAAKDSMTVVLVNRSTAATRATTANFTNFIIQSPNTEVLQLAALPSAETFNSHIQNALLRRFAAVTNNAVMLDLPPMSVTSFTVKGKIGRVPTAELGQERIIIYPNPFAESFKIEMPNGGFDGVSVRDALGKLVFSQKINVTDTFLTIKKTFPSGVYFVELTGLNGKIVKEITAFEK